MSEKEAREYMQEIKRVLDNVHFDVFDMDVVECINGEWKIEII